MAEAQVATLFGRNLVAHRFRGYKVTVCTEDDVPIFDERALDDDLDRHNHRRRSRAIFTWIALPAMAVPLRPLMATFRLSRHLYKTEPSELTSSLVSDEVDTGDLAETDKQVHQFVLGDRIRQVPD